MRLKKETVKAGGRPNKAALFSELVSDLQKDHIELSNLVFSFQNALAASDKKEAKKILDKIVDMTNKHFRFEEGYLYPRLRRLISEMIEKLSNEQKTIREFVSQMHRVLHMPRIGKNRLYDISKFIPIVSQHLNDCDDLIIMANKFGIEERNELNRKFKEYRNR